MIKRIVKKMHRINLINRILVYRTVKEEDLYFGQFPLLRYVGEHPGTTQREIAKNLYITPPSVTNSVKRMEKSGLVIKEEDPTNLRRSRISITDKGLQTLQVCRKKMHTIDASLFVGFTEEELMVLDGFMERILENLSQNEFKDRTLPELIGEAEKTTMTRECTKE